MSAPVAAAGPSAAPAPPTERASGWRAAVARVRGLRALAAVCDLLPPRLRYGHARTVARTVLGHAEVPGLAAPGARSAVGAPAGPDARASAGAAPGAGAPAPAGADLTCVLLAGGLDVGGVEAVVETLARGLPDQGVRTVVVGASGGRTADRLRAAGITVHLPGPAGLAGLLADLAPDVVQVHDASAAAAVADWGGPAVWVAHNLEIHRRPAEWAVVGAACARALAVVAVSDAVARHHSRHTGADRGDTAVIPNGVGELAVGPARDEARAALADVVPLEPGDLVVVSLARYDAQKNVPGLVRSFARALRAEPRLRLVVAGGVADVVEHRWADAERVASGASARVHLLGPSDSATLLAAADAFVLGSFFEGWSVAATEAVVAGLPVVLSDVGGAAELAALAPGRVTVVPPPTGDAPLTDGAVRAARRRRHQDNEEALAAALAGLPARVGSVAPDEGLVAVLSAEEMVARHAALLRDVTGRTGTR
ncbi:glycosyltransferase [Antribacter sp. KLBMP9083]|uniref:Glycosyltransferase n=1 Tax=Antribacter soli TaxID=2910976 RepID=A0AA41U5F8_9MICO|nr:glycosyltransferase [Antribacter soli]MCF4119983.1 glycosyltransferase [Antribacter soli]